MVCSRYCVGGNDVANSFATSVGAKALTLRQTIIIASICEFSGAMILGHKVTETIKGSIVKAEFFEDDPTLLMYGMMTVVIGCAIWLVVATLLSLPVSSTHTCIGGMLGMAIVGRGFRAIHWGMVINVICSWLYTPLGAGIISFLLFLLIRKTILLKEKSFDYSLNLFCPLIAFVLTLNFFVIFFGGCPWLPNFNWWLSLIVSSSLACLIALIVYFTVIPTIRRRGIKAEEDAKLNEALISSPEEKPQSTETVVDVPTDAPAAAADTNAAAATPATPSKATDGQDVFASVQNDETVAAIHEKAEHYDIKTEKVFIYLQVLAAILNSFAHGANDVSHSIGPLVACIEIYRTGTSQATTPTPAWILAFGALGIVIGLATMGYKVMATVGVNLVTVTPCRGFFIELAASLVVIVGSRCGLPLSTTQCKIGAAVGVGLVGGSDSVNWKLFGKIFSGWVITIIIAAIVSAILMECGIFFFHF